jgi:hypothetical protein
MLGTLFECAFIIMRKQTPLPQTLYHSEARLGIGVKDIFGYVRDTFPNLNAERYLRTPPMVYNDIK